MEFYVKTLPTQEGDEGENFAIMSPSYLPGGDYDDPKIVNIIFGKKGHPEARERADKLCHRLNQAYADWQALDGGQS